MNSGAQVTNPATSSQKPERVDDPAKIAESLSHEITARIEPEEKVSNSRPISTCSIASTGSSRASTVTVGATMTATKTVTKTPSSVVPGKTVISGNVAGTMASTAGRPGSAKRKVCELKCSEIRWFCKRDTDTKWTPFKGYDSTVLELAYRKHKDIPLDEMLQSHRNELPQTEQVIVLNGLYQLTMDKEGSNFDEISSVYWKEDTMQIRRGTWFSTDGSLQPEQVELADKIEEHHLKSFRGQIIPESPVFSETETSKKPVLTSLKWGENQEVRWNSVIDVSIVNIKRGNAIVNFFTRGKSITYLRRGYNEETRFEDGKPNFSDLILVVHGIGQKVMKILLLKILLRFGMKLRI
uniref:Phospholipase DDHD1 n=1 Tax=Ditylenchus dipsaci TaxID=166011 RepID=A0A915EKU5_9BILA